ncbi:MAG: DUF4136 domain-containing protein [Sphingomonadales bacterium]|jgi:hypothetical protein
MMKRVAAIMAVTFLQACAATSPVSQDVNLAIDYNRIDSFSLILDHPLALNKESDVFQTLGLEREQVEDQLKSILSAKGWAFRPKREDALVMVTLSLGERKDITLYRDYVVLGARGWLWSRDPRTGGRYFPDTLAIDVFDARSGNAIWHGYSRLSAYETNDQRQAFTLALIDILDAFPPDISKLRGTVQDSILVQ